jgi:hypothetical protein
MKASRLLSGDNVGEVAELIRPRASIRAASVGTWLMAGALTKANAVAAVIKSVFIRFVLCWLAVV